MSEVVNVGFLEKCEPWILESRFFPSKVGGKPAWLSLKNIPDEKDLACNNCDNPCIFLCQIYAPYEEDEKAFHRTIYIFICKDPKCCLENSNNNLKVFRSQLERKNEFYPFDPPLEEETWRADIKIEKWSKACMICGILALKHCSKCKKVNYCSRQHQIWDWHENHKKVCGQSLEEVVISNQEKYLFPEYELIIEEEEYDPNMNKVNEEEELKKYEKLVETGEAGSLQSVEDVNADLINMAKGVDDKIFSKFKDRIKNQSEQVIRYNRGGQPLFISSNNHPTNIPNCEECGGPRQFEFQIMPQLLNYLKITNDINCIDWGTLIIYTCKYSCVLQTKYFKEYVWKQDITSGSFESDTNTINNEKM